MKFLFLNLTQIDHWLNLRVLQDCTLALNQILGNFQSGITDLLTLQLTFQLLTLFLQALYPCILTYCINNYLATCQVDERAGTLSKVENCDTSKLAIKLKYSC